MTIASALLEKGGKPNNGQTIEEAIRDSAVGYDFVIWQDTTNSAATYEVVSGDWEAVKEKITSGEIINGILKSYGENPTFIRFISLATAQYKESPEEIVLSFVIPTWNGNDVTWWPVPLTWTSDGQITD